MTIDSKINCGGCIAKVQGDLDALCGSGNWSVDTTQPNKPLTFDNEIDVDDVLEVLEKFNMTVE